MGAVTEAFGVDLAGPDGAPALVLIHGSVVSRKMWLPQLRDLSDAFRVIAPDLPGHGDRASESFTFDAAVQTVGDVVRQYAAGRAAVAGLSLGGYVAIELAHRQPTLFSALMLTGCSVSFRGGLGLYLRAIAWAMRRGWIPDNRRQLEARTRRLFPPALADVAEAQMAAGLNGAALGAAFGEMAGRDFGARLDGFPQPLLILNGARDRWPVRAAAGFATGAPRRQVSVLPDAGHACSLDQPDAYNQRLRDFLRSCETSPHGNVRPHPEAP